MVGYIQVYTGNGKGKTTAALGLCLRAAGAGLKVFIVQFMKMGDYSEINALKRFSDLITVEQFGLGKWVKGKPSPEDKEAAIKGLDRAKEVLSSGQYDIVVLEEANMAVYFDLIPLDGLLALMAQKPKAVELIITGRNAHPKIMETADLVTEMKEIKHYYAKGVLARIGIEK